MLRPGCEARCPGCSHRAMSEQASGEAKMAWLGQALAPWRERLRPLRAPSGERRWGYRDKTCLRAEWDPSRERWKLGLRVRRPGSELKRDYEVIDIPGCPVHSDRVRAVVGRLAEELPEPEELPLSFVLVSGALVTLVLKSARMPGAGALERLRGLERELGGLGIQGFLLNLHPSAGERVLSAKGWHLLWGQRQATVELDHSPMTYGPDSFQQLIPELYADSLDEARAFLAPGADDSVIDLCSGSGATLRMWRESGARALGVELGAEAVRCAEINAGEGSCLRGKCSERLPQIRGWVDARRPRGRLLAYANPPRLGLEPEVVDWLASEAPRSGLARMAYLSCSAGTLSRDLESLVSAGYRVESIIPYDFFPQTPHVETLALLSLEAKA